MFERYNPELKTNGRKLEKVAEILKRFVLVGILLLGSEIGLHPASSDEKPENYSLAEVIELVDEEDRELFLNMTRDVVKKPVSIESPIPATEKNITISEIKKYLTTLPKGWVRGELVSIGATTDPDELRVPYFRALATFNNESKKIFFDYYIAKAQERGYNIYALSHEIAHGNDFLTDADITWAERYRLYKVLKQRIKSENRFRTNYLVMLEQEFDEGDFGWIPLLREYWAEICAQYMSDPTQLHIDDFELVHEFVIHNDSNYKWRERLGERAKIQGEFSNPHIPESE